MKKKFTFAFALVLIMSMLIGCDNSDSTPSNNISVEEGDRNAKNIALVIKMKRIHSGLIILVDWKMPVANLGFLIHCFLIRKRQM